MIKIINGIEIQSNGDDSEVFDLKEHNRLLSFIDINIAPYMNLKTYNKRFTSYKLKRVIEKNIGFYISNYELKLAMAERGFSGEYSGSSINCNYKLSQAQYKKLQELR